MVKCECGGDLKELYWSKFPFPEEGDQFISTEKYWMCHKCGEIYERQIQTNVVWNKLHGSASTLNLEEK